MIMKKIVTPELRVVRFESNDVIVTSQIGAGSTSNNYENPDCQDGGWTAPSRNGGVWD